MKVQNKKQQTPDFNGGTGVRRNCKNVTALYTNFIEVAVCDKFNK